MRKHVSKVWQFRHIRKTVGGTLFLMVAIICLLIVPMIIFSSQIGMLTVDRSRVQNIVEAAGLLAANDMSRIVINDPNFGYVSLSNYAPVGKGTIAGDGEPLPVWGINTLLGTIRQNSVIARELDNTKLAALVESDREDAERTIESLNKTLSDAVSGANKEPLTDINGNRVELVKDVQNFLKVNLPVNVKIESLKITNGWLKEGGRTIVPVPQPERLAGVRKIDSQNGLLKPFVNLPMNGKNYSLAGVGQASTIALNEHFIPADKTHINSIVRVECAFKVSRPGLPIGGGDTIQMLVGACAQPYSLPDVGPGGVMTLRFTSGPVAGLSSWSDFLREGQFRDRQIICYDVVGGDYQADKQAKKRMLMPKYGNSTSQEFAENLYCWLRSGHLRPRVDSIIDMINEQFKMGPQDLYAYEFANNGTISRRIIDKDPFPIGVTSDAQFSTMADTSVQGDKTPIIIFRNNVKRLGTIYGGKHAGQPLAGNPPNWCELQEYGGGEQLAAKLGRGRLGTGLVISDQTYQSGNANVITKAFSTLTGQNAIQPRTSFYSGGLALDIEIGGIRPSTALLDIDRMQKMKR